MQPLDKFCLTSPASCSHLYHKQTSSLWFWWWKSPTTLSQFWSPSSDAMERFGQKCIRGASSSILAMWSAHWSLLSFIDKTSSTGLAVNLWLMIVENRIKWKKIIQHYSKNSFLAVRLQRRKKKNPYPTSSQ